MGVITPNEPEWERMKADVTQKPTGLDCIVHYVPFSASRLVMRHQRRQKARTTWKTFERELKFLQNTSAVSWRSFVFAIGILFLSQVWVV